MSLFKCSIFVIKGFDLFGNNFFFRKKLVLLNFACFFLSTCYLVSLVRSHIILCRRSLKLQSNIFLGPKYGFKTSKAFSGKF